MTATRAQGGRRARGMLGALVVGLGIVLGSASAMRAVESPQPQPTEEPVPFGRVIYRAVRAGSFESLGITVIACRHRDPVPRRFMVDFYERNGRKVTSFGAYIAYDVPAGKKLVFVTDGKYFKNRDVWDVRLGHLTGGPGRIISDAEIVKCEGKIRFDGGRRLPSRWDSIGLHREGEPAPPRPEW